MTNGPEWFAPKRYGIGSGLPIAWQGWAVTLAYVAAVFVAALMLGDRPYPFIAAMIPLTAVFLVVTARTTRGGWRWRWGEED